MEHQHHHNPAKALQCDLCGKIVYTLNTLGKHKQAVHGPKPDKTPQHCKYCNNWYSSWSTFQHHMRNMHSNTDVEHRCDICGFVSTTRVAKIRHIRYKHTSGKPHKCTMCDKEFKAPILLKEHMATHTGIDLYSCSYCTATFKSKSNMYNHNKNFHPEEFEKRVKRLRIDKK